VVAIACVDERQGPGIYQHHRREVRLDKSLRNLLPVISDKSEGPPRTDPIRSEMLW
jgi:hypothetical protein